MEATWYQLSFAQANQFPPPRQKSAAGHRAVLMMMIVIMTWGTGIRGLMRGMTTLPKVTRSY